jgi:hypothetical protein
MPQAAHKSSFYASCSNHVLFSLSQHIIVITQIEAPRTLKEEQPPSWLEDDEQLPSPKYQSY